MKNLFFNRKSEEKKASSFELLSENEMLVIRGGAEPVKPSPRPRDVFDYE